ncbi:uncharacterized protein MKK02DRAFT_40376 [Dioszegia hungarica]|uniref:Protein CPL1-like domain-containing protein n=1 Tax=Dioszegia hungarica TaxID=4972 RepID=A0AA38H524_9TREE|nr:uncharacterized protein MKK02DRAFT_40376 [Dioszegia hungarica]KAI9632996.1 hypothetical protein MKK02DRAFT_40376 [Dioszegia hungarica]
MRPISLAFCVAFCSFFIPATIAQSVLGASCSGTGACRSTAYCSNGICGGPGAFCQTASTDCANGQNCLDNECTSLARSTLGGTCSRTLQCPASAQCTNGICGGPGGFCQNADTDCANGQNCLDSECTSLALSTLGGTCSRTLQCPASAQCTNGICGGPGGFCITASTDCANGQNCLDSECTSLARSTLGGTCSRTLQCPANSRCTDGICGGPGGFCITASTDCANGQNCLDNECTSLAPSTLGGTCSRTLQCPANARCTDGICGGPGGFCITASTDCANGQNCLDNECTSLAPSTLGGTCSRTLQCPANARCTDGICGGPGGFCITASTDCANGQNCLDNVCTSLAPQPLGATCSSNIQCPGNARCTDGICGGPGGFCITASTDCANGQNCLDNECTSLAPQPLGATCSSDIQCPGNARCFSNICGGTGAFCIADSGQSGGSGPSSGCFSGTCSAYACTMAASQRPQGRRDVATQWVASQSCRRGYLQCQVAPGMKLVECIDPLTDLENCGGCVVGENGTGVDCTVIPGVAGIRCQRGSCVIESCAEGLAYQEETNTCA